MTRAVILVLDSLGVGASADAYAYGDQGADTFGHIVEACANGQGDNDSRSGPIKIPNLLRWGLGKAAIASRGRDLPLDQPTCVTGAYGYAVEQSVGKDTPSGHWEICGLPVTVEWGIFDNKPNCFPPELMSKLCQQGDIKGTLANCHASGTEVIKQFGEQHMLSGWPICYTSSDSVFQIAAHEGTFGLQRLLDLCDIAKPLMDELNVGRVIARPFLGTCPEDFTRTENRKDLTTPPMDETLLDVLQKAHIPVVGLGKIADIFSYRGIDKVIKGPNNAALMDRLMEQMQVQEDGLIFVNFVDFDSMFGHRRNLSGYAQALEAFDQRIPELETLMQADDVILVTADHGCDPSMPGSDHTREHVPMIFVGPKVASQNLGKRQSFADMGQTLASYFNIPPLKAGKACVIF